VTPGPQQAIGSIAHRQRFIAKRAFKTPGACRLPALFKHHTPLLHLRQDLLVVEGGARARFLRHLIVEAQRLNRQAKARLDGAMTARTVSR
jgi:hypothetical protein